MKFFNYLFLFLFSLISQFNIIHSADIEKIENTSKYEFAEDEDSGSDYGSDSDSDNDDSDADEEEKPDISVYYEGKELQNVKIEIYKLKEELLRLFINKIKQADFDGLDKLIDEKKKEIIKYNLVQTLVNLIVKNLKNKGKNKEYTNIIRKLGSFENKTYVLESDEDTY